MEELEPVQEAIAMGQMELARNLLRILIEDYPDNADVWYHAAQAAVNDTQRKAFLEKSVVLDPLHHQAANDLYNIQNGHNIRPIKRADSTQKQVATKPAYASFFQRAIALIVDIILLTLVTTPVSAIILGIVAPGVTPNPMNLLDDTWVFFTLLLISTLFQALYYGYFLTQKNGQTIGKRLMGIRVVKRDGSKLTIRDALLRNVLGYQVSHIIPGIGYLWMFTNREARTWHDYLSNTIVVVG